MVEVRCAVVKAYRPALAAYYGQTCFVGDII
jgi:hypothetical protein